MKSYHRQHRNKPMSEINVVPYIDVMLVLLVIFMVTSPMLSLTEGVEVHLPQAAGNEVPPSEVGPLIVTVWQDGRLALTYDEQIQEPVTRELVGARLRAVLLAQERPVLVKGDSSASYGSVVEIMALLQALGVAKIGFITEPPETNL
jgi:biopolymer transport protein TolR